MEEVTEEKSDLAESLENVALNTLDGDSCLGEITEIKEPSGRFSRDGEQVQVTVRLPSGQPHKEYFERPEADSDKYRLVRLLDSVGYGILDVDRAVGAEVRIDITDDGPEIRVPERPVPLGERLAERVPSWAVGVPLGVVGLLLWPIAGIYLTRSVVDSGFFVAYGDGPDAVDWIWLYGMLGYTLWIGTWALIGTVLFG